ncbi:hypothetical protein Vretifemale_10148, partial [Volvox reticuliferus]
TWITGYPGDWIQLRDTWEQEKRFFIGTPPLPNLLRPVLKRASAASPRPVATPVAALTEEVGEWRLFEVAPHPVGPEHHSTDNDKGNAASGCRDGDGDGDDDDDD